MGEKPRDEACRTHTHTSGFDPIHAEGTRGLIWQTFGGIQDSAACGEKRLIDPCYEPEPRIAVRRWH